MSKTKYDNMRTDYTEKNNRNGGVQLVWKFPNGYEVSVIHNSFSYGHKQGLWEAAIMIGDQFDITNPISSKWGDEVKGHLSQTDVNTILNAVEKFKEVN